MDVSDDAKADYKPAYEAQLAALTTQLKMTADEDAYMKAEAEIEALEAKWASGAFAVEAATAELTKATAEGDAAAPW